MTTTPADIMEALGHHDAAATLRWGETPRSVLEAERAEFAGQLNKAVDRLARLEALLCKRCGAKWDDATTSPPSG